MLDYADHFVDRTRPSSCSGANLKATFRKRQLDLNTMLTSHEQLRASLEEHNSEFEALLRLIPAKYYIAPDEAVEYVRRLDFPSII